jgi:hypothetical protein
MAGGAILTSNDKDGAEAFEIGKSTRVVPVLCAKVSLIADTAAVDDDAEDDEAHAGADFDYGQNKLDCD